MEGNVTERRLSHSVTPTWLEPNQEGTVTLAISRDPSPNNQPQQTGGPTVAGTGRYEQRMSIDDGKKLHIQTSATTASKMLWFFEIKVNFTSLFFNSAPKIQIQPLPRHRPATETNFENTEVEELIAMLRETENLEEQGDILQHLVDTQGLDFNTGKAIWDGLSAKFERQYR